MFGVHPTQVGGWKKQALAGLPDIFYRVDTVRGEDGTGLGLAIAKWIVDSHRAEIHITSTERLGTTFEVRFPLFRVADPS